MPRLKHNRFIRLLFFGNYFYGICAVALSAEAALQQGFPLPGPLFFLLAFSSTVLYYTRAYLITEVPASGANIRSLWYSRNYNSMKLSQGIFMLLLLGGGLVFLISHQEQVLFLAWKDWLILLLFPVIAAFYYGVNDPVLGKHNLRNVGWLKPFIIGFSWAGMVTIYPAMYYCIENEIDYRLTFTGTFLFIKNFMFVTILCIMFDIKDYAMDYNHDIKTIVLKLGLRRTIFRFIIPLSLVGLSSFLIYARSNDFSAQKIIINTLPFIAMITAAYSLSNRRSIFYYLIIIDGLMLFKAICGITAMLFF